MAFSHFEYRFKDIHVFVLKVMTSSGGSTKTAQLYSAQQNNSRNIKERGKAIWKPCVFRARPSGSLKKVANRDTWFFKERDWSQACCHSNNIVGVIVFPL